ncbi:MAG: hypothetical protein ACRET4_11405, partial [Steroidobacteraceae bacterium]
MPTQKSNNEPGDLRWKLIDSIIRRLAYLVAQVGISPERFIERVCHVVDGMKPPTPAGHTPSESRTFAEAHSGPEIMHVWFGELDFLDSSGQPKRLPLAGGRQSFEDLVRRSVPGVKPANALSDLLAARAVQLTEDGCVVPVKASLVVSDTHRGAEMGLYSVANLLDSIQSNVGAAPTNRTFQREAVCLRFDRSHMPRVH